MKHAKRVVTALSTAALAVTAILLAPKNWFPPVFAILAVLCAIEFAQLLKRRLDPASGYGMLCKTCGLLVLACSFAMLSVIAVCGGNLWLLYAIACVKLSDMSGFAFGVAWGKHKMCPSISPNKSWEGMCGSIIGSCLISCAFLGFTHFALPKALLIGVVAAFVGTAGDLVESKFKRWVGVKDSGTFMPAGLGGMLDMFDSLLFAPGVIWLIAK